MSAATMTNQSIADQCVRACVEVIRLASLCVDECLRDQSGKMTECLRLCLDCLALCTACGTMVSRNSRFGNAICGVCADACIACADECERQADRGGIMRESAQACRRCAEACRKMTGQAA